jgi:hypothetical protein
LFLKNVSIQNDITPVDIVDTRHKGQDTSTLYTGLVKMDFLNSSSYCNMVGIAISSNCKLLRQYVLVRLFRRALGNITSRCSSFRAVCCDCWQMHCIADLLVHFANSRVCEALLVHAFVCGIPLSPGLSKPSEDLFPIPAPPATAGSELVCGEILSDIVSYRLYMVVWKNQDFELWWNLVPL